MTPEAQNRAIAEAVGYRYLLDDSRPGPDLHNFVPPGVDDVDSEEAGIWHMNFGYAVKDLPDFCADLNAMRSALMTLSDEEWIRYEVAIFTILEREGPQVCGRPRFLLSSAPQQAEAFCRVKYPESFTPTGT